MALEKTLVLLKPCTLQRGLVGEIVSVFEKKGLQICGMKMMQLSDELLSEHYAHLSEKPFFQRVKDAMMTAPVIAMCLKGVDAIAAVRAEPDPEKRLIKVAVYSQGGFAMLRFEHYTEAAPALDADGLPKQGSDLKSVRTTVGQHGGSMTLHWENNWCTLRILFPLPKNK